MAEPILLTERKYDNVGESLWSARLANGLELRVARKPGFYRSFALLAADYGGADRLFSRDGVRHDTPAGVAHFLEHKLFDMPDGSNALAVLAQNGAQPNAFTSDAVTAYFFESTEDFEANLKSLISFVSTPYFSAESVAKEQGIIGQEIRMTEDNPDFVVYVNLMRCLYSTGPLRDSVAGTLESIAQITADTLYECHRAFYTPANMCLTVVGDQDPARVLDLAQALLPPEPGEAPRREYGLLAGEAPSRRRFEASMAVSAPQFLLGTRLPLPEKGDARLRARLTAELSLKYLMGPSSKLFTALYAEGLLKNDFGYDVSAAAGERTLCAGGESRDPDQVLARIVEQAQKAAAGMDGTRFRRIRRSLYGEYLRGLERFDGLAVDLAAGVFDGCCPLDAFALLPNIEPKDCALFLKESFAPEKIALSVVSPADKA